MGEDLRDGPLKRFDSIFCSVYYIDLSSVPVNIVFVVVVLLFLSFILAKLIYEGGTM